MDDIIFQVGDRVKILPAYRAIAPESPIVGMVLTVCAPGDYRARGEVPVSYNGEVYYVPAGYVQAV